MDTLAINTSEELHAWLQSHSYFIEGTVLAMQPMPVRSGVVPETVALELSYQIAGGYQAGEDRILYVCALTANGVKEWRLEGPYSADYVIERGIQPADGAGNLRLLADVPGILQLSCDSIIVEALPERKEIIAPIASMYEFSAMVPGMHLPATHDWLEWLKEYEQDAEWHNPLGIGEDEEGAVSAYSGWYLQNTSSQSSSGPGVFFHTVAERGNGFVVHLQLHDRSAENLWKAVGDLVGRMADAEIRTGNVQLTGNEWRQFLRDGYLEWE